MKKMENIKVKRGIRRVILSGFLIILILTQLITSVATYTKSSNLIESRTIEATDGITSEISIAVENYLATYESIIRTLAREDSLKNLAASPDNELRALNILNNYVNVNTDILFLYLGTADGRMIMKPDDDLGDDYDPRVRDWYKDTLSANDFIWTDPYFDDTVGKMVVSASMPVFADDGTLSGVLALDLALDAINNQTNTIKIGEKGYPIVVDANNIILAHQDIEKVGTELTSPDLIEALKDETKTGVTYTYDSNGHTKEKYASIVRIEKMGWAVLATTYFDEIEEDTRSIIYINIIASAISILLAIISVMFLTSGFMKNIKSLLTAMQVVRTGDLSTKSNITSNDEIGVLSKFFDDTISDLGKLVNNVQGASIELTNASQNLAATSQEVSASSDEVAKTVDDIAVGAQDQARDAEDGSLIASELSNKVSILNELKSSMLESAKSLQIANSDGVDSINELKEKNNESISANKQIEEVIGELNERTNLIGSILDSISAIAVQTNLLALNASIEAARAGEHGRGFAVVADEIRKLAEESSKSADEVREIVQNIQVDSNKSVDSMGQLKKISTSQNDAVTKVISAFEMIKVADEKISVNIEKISMSVNGLAEDKDKIVSSIENISAVSEETAAASEEVTASMQQQVYAIEEVAKSAQSLNEISANLNMEISKFKV